LVALINMQITKLIFYRYLLICKLFLVRQRGAIAAVVARQPGDLLTLLTYFLTYLLTYLLHGAESFLRS
jgi:hypothetical protein